MGSFTPKSFRAAEERADFRTAPGVPGLIRTVTKGKTAKGRRAKEAAGFAVGQAKERSSQAAQKAEARRKALALTPGQNVLTDQTRLGEPITGRRRLQV